MRLEDVLLVASVHETSLGLGHRVLEHAQHEPAAVDRARLRRASPDVLAEKIDDGVRDRCVESPPFSVSLGLVIPVLLTSFSSNEEAAHREEENAENPKSGCQPLYSDPDQKRRGALGGLDLERELPQRDDQPLRDPARTLEVRHLQVHALAAHGCG